MLLWKGRTSLSAFWRSPASIPYSTGVEGSERHPRMSAGEQPLGCRVATTLRESPDYQKAHSNFFQGAIVKAADGAWLTLATGILVFDLAAPETMSEAMDRYRKRQPVVSRLALTIFWLHLMRLLPGWCDPLHGFDLHRHIIKRFWRGITNERC